MYEVHVLCAMGGKKFKEKGLLSCEGEYFYWKLAVKMVASERVWCEGGFFAMADAEFLEVSLKEK